MLYAHKDFLGLKEIIKLHVVTDATDRRKKKKKKVLKSLQGLTYRDGYKTYLLIRVK